MFQPIHKVFFGMRFQDYIMLPLGNISGRFQPFSIMPDWKGGFQFFYSEK